MNARTTVRLALAGLALDCAVVVLIAGQATRETAIPQTAIEAAANQYITQHGGTNPKVFVQLTTPSGAEALVEFTAQASTAQPVQIQSELVFARRASSVTVTHRYDVAPRLSIPSMLQS